MALGPFSPLLVEGKASRQVALLLFPQGGSAQSRERRKNVRNVVAHLPSAADLPTDRVGARGSSLVWTGMALITALLVGLNEGVQDLQMDLVMSVI